MVKIYICSYIAYVAQLIILRRSAAMCIVQRFITFKTCQGHTRSRSS